MKRLFLIIFGALALASFLLRLTEPDRGSPVPVLYWITQNDPVKLETIRRFEQWLRDNNLPLCEVRIDNVNRDPTKKLAQGLAGVGSDLMDIYSTETEQFARSGMLLDVTDAAKRLGYGPDKTYPALRSDLVVDGRQYGFPRNVASSLFWINRDTFAAHGLKEPEYIWNWDEFERLGKQFVEAANPPGTRQRSYFTQLMPPNFLRRGLGLSIFNETMTRCTLDDPRNAEVMRRLKRWTNDLHLIPTLAEQTAMTADVGRAGDAWFYLFSTGRYATLYLPRWGLIRLRPLGKLNMRIVIPPTSGFPNTEFSSGFIAGYAGTKYPEHVQRFQQFLTSKSFNVLVAESGDSLPPVPGYVHTEEFMRPPEHPEEWPLADVFAVAAPEFGITICRSPFVPSNVITRPITGIDSSVIDEVIAGRVEPEDAGRIVAQRVDQEIARNIEHNEPLRAEYERLLAVQAQIDTLRAAGKKVPAAWITNPFHLIYYQAQGWLEETSP